MTLRDAFEGQDYTIKEIKTGDRELDSFLFSLGCYSGETVCVVSHKKSSSIISVKNARYCIDLQLAKAIII